MVLKVQLKIVFYYFVTCGFIFNNKDVKQRKIRTTNTDSAAVVSARGAVFLALCCNKQKTSRFSEIGQIALFFEETLTSS